MEKKNTYSSFRLSAGFFIAIIFILIGIGCKKTDLQTKEAKPTKREVKSQLVYQFYETNEVTPFK